MKQNGRKYINYISTIFLLFVIISSTKEATNEIIMIGDSRTCGMAFGVFRMDYTHATQYYGTGSYITTTSYKNYGDYKIKVSAEVGASAYTFTSSTKDVYKSMHTQLSGASAGTKVFLWLGVNGLDSKSTANLYLSLASKYTKLQFYAFSITGVSSISKSVTNEGIKTFNSNLRSAITGKYSNLRYVSILSNNNPTQIYNKSSKSITLTINDSTADNSMGLHYYTDGYLKIFRAMVSDL